MSVLQLLLREARHRLPGFGLGLLAVIAAAGLFVAMATMGRASNAEASRLMRNLGFNLLVLPRGTDLVRYWATDEVSGDMPQEYVTRLAGTRGIGADHYVATLQRKIAWRGLAVLLTGVLPERNAVDAPGKASMGYKVSRGTCYVGFAIADRLGLRRGASLDVRGTRLRVERCLAEDSSKEDVRLYVHLQDAQTILRMAGRINTIQALGCLCAGGPLAILRERIGRVLPDTYVSELRNIAAARSDTRLMVEQHTGAIIAVVVIACAAWVGLLALLNVRERRQEIGILRALGFGSGRIGSLFIGRALAMGALGGPVGFLAGTALALGYGPHIYKLTFAKLHPAYDLLVPTTAAAILVAAVAALLPTMVAVTQDPAVTLTEE